MTVRWPFLIPIAAFVFVAAMFGVTLALQSADHAPAAPVATATPVQATPTPSPTPERRFGVAVLDDLSGSVCQGIFSRPPEGEPREFAPEYTQIREVLGIAIVGGANVAPEALDIAEETIKRVFLNNDLEEALEEAQAYVIVAEPDQDVLDLPEFSCLEDSVSADFFDDVCGVADRAAYPVVTVNALDLLGDESGPCEGVNILFHELGHMVQSWAMAPADYFESRLLHHDATTAGLYLGDYASRSIQEYWAEGTQAFFLYAAFQPKRDRVWLSEYDPALYELMTLVYGEGTE